MQATTLRTPSSLFPLVLILVLSASMVLSVAPSLSPGLSGVDILASVKFVQDFLIGSVFLGMTVAIIVNLFKPKIPDGYADTFSTIVTIVLLSLIFIAKALFPGITLLGLEKLFEDLTKYSPLWVPVLAWIVRYISGEAHNLFAGIPIIGYSHSFGSIAGPSHTQR